MKFRKKYPATVIPGHSYSSSFFFNFVIILLFFFHLFLLVGS